MLQQFLQTIHREEVQSLTEIARTLAISVDMAARMAKELASKGYLQEVGGNCTGSEKSCPDCPVNATCQTITQRWFLTEKGRAAIAPPTHPR